MNGRTADNGGRDGLAVPWLTICPAQAMPLLSPCLAARARTRLATQ